MDHYLTVNKWKPNFRPSEAVISSTMVWIRLPEIPIEFFNEPSLMKIGNKLGKAVRVDRTTLAVARGKYARICLEVDFTTFKVLVKQSLASY